VHILKTTLSLSFLALLSGPLVGCGNSGAPTITSAGPAGKAAQGAVSGATVWADAIGTGTQFVIDSSEQGTQTTTSSTGTYTLPETPSYKYAIVSQGGIDTITKLPATTMIAPGGAECVSPLTSLMELDTSDPSGQLATNLSSILPVGVNFGEDITAPNALSPASMLFLTSISTAVTAFDAALQDAATKSGATLTPQQINNINLTLYSQMASQFSTLTPATIANTASLATSLQAALTSAITTVAANNPNITVQNPATIAASIADNSVATAANIVGNATNNPALQNISAASVQNTPGVAVTTGGGLTEAVVLTPANTQIITNAITSVATTAAASITAASTPSSYSPPPIPVATNPTIVGYGLVAEKSGNEWAVTSLTMTFSDDMVASNSGGSNFAHSVLNPANYQFNQPGCSPSSYSSKVVTFTCGTIPSGDFVMTTLGASSTGGVEASATSLGLLINNVKTFTLPAVTGSNGGNGIALF